MSTFAKATAALKKHPWLSAASLVCVLGGLVGIYLLDPTGWGHGRKIAAGLLAGAGVAYTIITTRMVGAWTEDSEG